MGVFKLGNIFKRKETALSEVTEGSENAEHDNAFCCIYGLKQGEAAEIIKIRITGNAAVRLNSLGITAGKKINVLSYSLFKSSVLIGCGGVRLGIRKSLAKQIEVKKCGG